MDTDSERTHRLQVNIGSVDDQSRNDVTAPMFRSPVKCRLLYGWCVCVCVCVCVWTFVTYGVSVYMSYGGEDSEMMQTCTTYNTLLDYNYTSIQAKNASQEY